MSDNARVMELICSLLQRSGHTLFLLILPKQRPALRMLRAMRALRLQASEGPDALCPSCVEWMGTITPLSTDDPRALGCDCHDCGLVPLTPEDRMMLELDPSWLTTQLRLALDVSSDEAVVELAEGIWRIGTVRRQPVVLGRSVRQLQGRPALLTQLHNASGRPVIVIAPQPPLPLQAEPFDARVVWLPLQRSFVFDGKRLRCVEPAVLRRTCGSDAASIDPRPVYGPFSEDFRWVFVADSPYGPIQLSKAQAAVLRALWEFGGEPRSGDEVMRRAGLSSDKPGDVFKVRRKGAELHEAPQYAYRTLVQVDQRSGLYRLPCAILAVL